MATTGPPDNSDLCLESKIISMVVDAKEKKKKKKKKAKACQ